MFIRRAAATLLVDAQMAIRSGAWTPSLTHSPTMAMLILEMALASPLSDDDVAQAADALQTVIGEAMMAGEACMPGYEQFELGDVHPELIVETPAAANDDVLPLRRAA